MDDLIATGIGWLHTAGWLAALTAVFGVLARLTPCNPGMYWWKNLRAVWADFFYWFIVPLFTHWSRIALLALGIQVFFGGQDPEWLPVWKLALWQQCLAVLLLQDVFLYISHRFFHTPLAWGFHAVHHSPTVLDWTSTSRFHPINILLGSASADVLVLLLGFPPTVLFSLAPFNLIYSAMVHANLNWTFGPFRYVLASPVFHRWHHTTQKEGLDKNFASTFPILDVLFGTFYMPADRLPADYGNGDPFFPEGFFGQLVHPFLRWRPRRAVGWLAARPMVAAALAAVVVALGAQVWYTARLSEQNAQLARQVKKAQAAQQESHSARQAVQLDLAQRAWVQNDLTAAETALKALDGTTDSTGQQQRLRDLCRQKRLVLPGYSRGVTCVALDAEGTLAASGSEDGAIKIHDARTGGERLCLKAHERAVRGVAFLAGGKSLASASFDGTIKVWNLKTGKCVRMLAGGGPAVLGLSVGSDGRRLAVCRADLSARIYDVSMGREIGRVIRLSSASPGVALCGDDRLVTAGSPTVKVHDARTGKELLTLVGHGDLVYAVATSPDGGQIATGSFDGTVRVWDALGTQRLRLEGHTGPVYGVAVCAGADRIVSASKDGTVKVWDGRTGQERLSLRGHAGAVSSVAVSGDGSRILSGAVDGTLTVWNSRRCSPQAMLELTRGE